MVKSSLPKNQYWIKKRPIISVDSFKNYWENPWSIEIDGLVEKKLELSYDDILKMPQNEAEHDLHCVDGWSVPDMKFDGVLVYDFLNSINAKGALYLWIESIDRYTSGVDIEELLDEKAIFALKIDSQKLTANDGAPMRLITPKHFAYKGAKWIKKITLTNQFKKGFWEQRGYHARARVFEDERFAED